MNVLVPCNFKVFSNSRYADENDDIVLVLCNFKVFSNIDGSKGAMFRCNLVNTVLCDIYRMNKSEKQRFLMQNIVNLYDYTFKICNKERA